MADSFIFDKVSCRYNQGSIDVLKDLSFEIAPGERALVLGPSGSGKTTLLRVLAGLERPSAGKISMGSTIWSENGKLRLAPEKRRVGYVFQQLALWSQMTVRESLLFVSPFPRKEAEDKAKRLAEAFGIGAKLGRYPHELSGGEAQRLALARALCQEPSFLLLDEALAKLDAPLRRGILHDLLTYLDGDKALRALFVTHQKAEAHLFSDRVLLLDEGKLVENGSLTALTQEPTTTTVARLLDLGTILEGTVKENQAETLLGLVNFRFSGEPFKSADRLSLLLRSRDWLFEEDVAGDAIVVGVESYDGRDCVVTVEIAGQLFQALAKEPYPRGTRLRWTFTNALRAFAKSS